MANNIYSVAKINSYIKGLLAEDFLLRDVRIRGEISNLKYHSSGHIYFTLKDEGSAISGVMFASMRSNLSFQLREGMMVVVRGSVEVYERDGKYQIYAKGFEKDGEGKIYEEFLKLKERLEESGMFAPEYKKPIPKYIDTLGVVTAQTGAAIRDIINIAKRRNPYVRIVLYPAIVQGEAAAESIVKGIKALENFGVDVMIVGRGGGSIEDLWAFNEEIVAEAVFDCSVPVISAVGHETDFTIIDFVSDLRAPTPSAGAELAVYSYDDLNRTIGTYEDALSQNMMYIINDKRRKLNELSLCLRSKNPRAKLNANRTYALSLEEKLSMLMKNKLSAKRHELGIYAERLKGLSPLDKLSQGYSYTMSNDKTVNSVESVKVDDDLCIYVKDGTISARVTATNKETYGSKI